jgi:hypothetical protein
MRGWWRYWPAIAWLGSGCELIFRPGGAAIDAAGNTGGDADEDVDAPTDAAIDGDPACMPFTLPNFAITESLAIVGDDPSANAAFTELLYANAGDIYQTDGDGDGGWNVPGVLIDALSAGTNPTGDPAHFPDANRVYFSRGNDGRAKQSDGQGTTWSMAVDVNGWVPPGGDKNEFDVRPGSPSVLIGGVRSVVISRRTSNGSVDDTELHEYENNGPGGTWVERPGSFALINSNVADRDPHLSPDACSVVFSSNRLGEDRLFVAWRARRDEPFTDVDAIPVSPMIGDSDTGPWLSADGLRLLFARRSSPSTVYTLHYSH